MDQCFHNLDFGQLQRFGIWESGGKAGVADSLTHRIQQMVQAREDSVSATSRFLLVLGPSPVFGPSPCN